MPSKFDRRFAASGLARLMSQLGEEATYTPASGDAVSLTGIFNEYTAQKDEDDSGLVLKREARFTCYASAHAVYGGIVDVQVAGTLTITASGETWQIAGLPQRLGGYVELRITITERMEKTRRQYRR